MGVWDQNCTYLVTNAAGIKTFKANTTNAQTSTPQIPLKVQGRGEKSGKVVHAFISSTWEAEAQGISVSSRQVWSTQLILGHPQLHKENLVFQVREKKKGKVLVLTVVGFIGYCS